MVERKSNGVNLTPKLPEEFRSKPARFALAPVPPVPPGDLAKTTTCGGWACLGPFGTVRYRGSIRRDHRT